MVDLLGGGDSRGWSPARDDPRGRGHPPGPRRPRDCRIDSWSAPRNATRRRQARSIRRPGRRPRSGGRGSIAGPRGAASSEGPAGAAFGPSTWRRAWIVGGTAGTSERTSVTRSSRFNSDPTCKPSPSFRSANTDASRLARGPGPPFPVLRAPLVEDHQLGRRPRGRGRRLRILGDGGTARFELFDHVGHRRRPIGRTLRHHLLIDVLQSRRYVGARVAEPRRWTLHVRHQPPQDRVPHERLAASQQVVERAAQAVDVGAVVGLPRVLGLLRRHVIHCPHVRPALRQARPGRLAERVGCVDDPRPGAQGRGRARSPRPSRIRFEGLMSRCTIPCE